MQINEIEKQFGKTAFVCDQMIQFGGADREMISMLKLFPNADIYTILYNPDAYPMIKNNVYTSFLQKFPLPKSFSRHLKVFTPIAYETFDLRGYDLVISLSAGPAKGVITGLDQVHVAMVMTPPRSLWDHELNVRASKFKSLYYPISKILNNYMRIWDYSISKRVDYWTANSEYISNKIFKRYRQHAIVVNPGLPEECYHVVSNSFKKFLREKYELGDSFVLVVSRLYDHKRVDVAIRACMETGKDLVIVGEGPDYKYLKKVANNCDNVKFIGFVRDDKEVRGLYSMAEVLLFCGIEDFGLVPVEAMAQGTPVFAYREGGVLETVKEGVSGEFFESEEELIKLLTNFDKRRYNPERIRKRAYLYTEERFLEKLQLFFKDIYEKENSGK